MKFGVFIPQGWRFDLVGVPEAEQWSLMRDLTLHVESQYVGDRPAWESAWVYDHFHTTPLPSDEATHEAWSLMAGLAASTSRIRLGQMWAWSRNAPHLVSLSGTRGSAEVQTDSQLRNLLMVLMVGEVGEYAEVSSFSATVVSASLTDDEPDDMARPMRRALRPLQRAGVQCSKARFHNTSKSTKAVCGTKAAPVNSNAGRLWAGLVLGPRVGPVAN